MHYRPCGVLEEVGEEVICEDCSNKISAWKSLAKRYYMILEVIWFSCIIMAWYLIYTMAKDAALSYPNGDLIYPFVFGSGVIILVDLFRHFSRILTDVYHDEISDLVYGFIEKCQELKTRITAR